MNVSLRLDQVSISLGNNGIHLAIKDPKGVHVGDLRIGRANVVWMRGKTSEKNGKKIPLKKLLDILDSV